jgi:hypothetical protein
MFMPHLSAWRMSAPLLSRLPAVIVNSRPLPQLRQTPTSRALPQGTRPSTKAFRCPKRAKRRSYRTSCFSSSFGSQIASLRIASLAEFYSGLLGGARTSLGRFLY